MDYYFEFCLRPYDSVFTFEEHYSSDFLVQSGYSNVDETLHWSTLLDDTVGEALWEEYLDYYLKARCKEHNAAFLFNYVYRGSISGEDVKLVVAKDEDPTEVLNRFIQYFGFLTGVKASKSRLAFYGTTSYAPLAEDKEVILQAMKRRVGVRIVSRPWQPDSDSWRRYESIIAMIMKKVFEEKEFFPLHYRFRLWTIIWGTARTIKKLIEANPDLIEKARSLGVSGDVFSDVLDAQIPSNPATELIPLEILESVLFLRALLGYMNDSQLIVNDAGYSLEVKTWYLWNY